MMSNAPHQAQTPFWQQIRLSEMSPEQWESLCDGCGRCCVNKYRDEDTDAIHYTDVACRLLDRDTCRCRDYARRAEQVDDCVTLTLDDLADPRWLPESCAYRRLAEGRGLPNWHPLVSGDPDSVHAAGMSVRGRVRCETETEDPLLHLVDWIR